jgi:hypothetical protein
MTMHPSGDSARQTVLTDHEVIDERRSKIGTVTDVLYDASDATPRWATVSLGLFSGEHYIPLSDAYQAEDGRVVVPYDKSTVKRAPKANRDHVLTPDVEDELRRYYGVAS